VYSATKMYPLAGKRKALYASVSYLGSQKVQSRLLDNVFKNTVHYFYCKFIKFESSSHASRNNSGDTDAAVLQVAEPRSWDGYCWNVPSPCEQGKRLENPNMFERFWPLLKNTKPSRHYSSQRTLLT